MEREEAKALVEKELESCGKFFIIDEKDNKRTSYEDANITLSIQFWPNEINVFLNFKKDGLDYDITLFRATPQSIAHLFTEYKKIREMK